MQLISSARSHEQEAASLAWHPAGVMSCLWRAAKQSSHL